MKQFFVHWMAKLNLVLLPFLAKFGFWGMGALASTINLDAITPSNPLAPVKPDALWAHTSTQWLNDIGVLIVIGLIFLGIAGFRLSKIGPRRRKAVTIADRQPASLEQSPVRSIYS